MIFSEFTNAKVKLSLKFDDEEGLSFENNITDNLRWINQKLAMYYTLGQLFCQSPFFIHLLIFTVRQQWLRIFLKISLDSLQLKFKSLLVFLYCLEIRNLVSCYQRAKIYQSIDPIIWRMRFHIFPLKGYFEKKKGVNLYVHLWRLVY